MENIGFTSGCFDILHPLHLQYLNKCKRECDKLIVLLDTDAYIYKRKGVYPTMNEDDRAYLLQGLKTVDTVIMINSLKEYEIVITQYLTEYPNLKIFKHNSHIDGAPLLIIPNINNHIIPDVRRYESSTQIKQSLKL